MSLIWTFGDQPGQLATQRLTELPSLINEPGTYTTRGGEHVEVSAILPPGRLFRCIGKYSNGIHERWHVTGRISSSRITVNDIVSKAG